MGPFQRLVNDVTCNGVRVWQVANTTEIVGAGEESLSTVFVHLARVYPLSHSNTSASGSRFKVSKTPNLCLLLLVLYWCCIGGGVYWWCIFFKCEFVYFWLFLLVLLPVCCCVQE